MPGRALTLQRGFLCPAAPQRQRSVCAPRCPPLPGPGQGGPSGPSSTPSSSAGAPWQLFGSSGTALLAESQILSAQAKPKAQRLPLHGFTKAVQHNRVSHGDDSCCAPQQGQHFPSERAPGPCPGPARAALTEPGRELLGAQAPGSSSIQPIEHQLQLLPAARQTFLLQFLNPKQSRVKTPPITPSPVPLAVPEPR